MFVGIIDWYLVEFEVAYKSKESFYCHMLVFILNPIKTHIFASFEYVGAVVFKYFLQIGDSYLIKWTITVNQPYSFFKDHDFFHSLRITLTLRYFHLIDLCIYLHLDVLFGSGIPK